MEGEEIKNTIFDLFIKHIADNDGVEKSGEQYSIVIFVLNA